MSPATLNLQWQHDIPLSHSNNARDFKIDLASGFCLHGVAATVSCSLVHAFRKAAQQGLQNTSKYKKTPHVLKQNRQTARLVPTDHDQKERINSKTADSLAESKAQKMLKSIKPSPAKTTANSKHRQQAQGHASIPCEGFRVWGTLKPRPKISGLTLTDQAFRPREASDSIPSGPHLAHFGIRVFKPLPGPSLVRPGLRSLAFFLQVLRRQEQGSMNYPTLSMYVRGSSLLAGTPCVRTAKGPSED